MTVPAADRETETIRLRGLGLRVPDGGVVLERPWDEPFTRRSFVVPQAWFVRPTPDGGVLSDDLQRDVFILEQVMSRVYGGWDAAKARGWDWQNWFSEWQTSLAKRRGQKLSLAEAFAPVKKLMQFQLDNHTNIPISRETVWGSASQSFVVHGLPREPCTELKTADGKWAALDPKDPAQRVRTAKHWDSKARTMNPVAYLSLPGNRGDLIAIQCAGQWLALQPAWPPRLDPLGTADEIKARAKPIVALSRAAKDEPELKLLEPSIVYVRLPTFTKVNTQLIEQRMNSWPKPTGKERVLIVDLRNNEGGDIALKALADWLDPRAEPSFQAASHTHRHQGASCLYHALRWGYTLYSSQRVPPRLGEKLTQQFQSAIDDLFQPSAPNCPRAFQDTDGGWDYRQHRMLPPGPVEGHRRILVLVNNGTGSDAEAMTALLASLPETVIAGTNTLGVAQYIQPGYSVLPHTRLPFRIALGTTDWYGDHRSFDGYGFDVDVLLSTEGDHSPENVLSLAKYIGG